MVSTDKAVSVKEVTGATLVIDDGPYERNRALRDAPEYRQMVKESVDAWHRRRKDAAPLV